ncbi:Uncharacterised protein [Burkholderia pseudomallei]|nr:Uncharacterised protein [Burkholderia pseudomallei]
MDFPSIAVPEDRLGSNLGVAKSCNEVGEAIRLQPVPEYLSQSCGKSIEAAQIQAGVLNEQRATDGLERLGQLVPYQTLDIFCLELLDFLRHRHDVHSYGGKDPLHLCDLVRIARHESDFQFRPFMNE